MLANWAKLKAAEKAEKGKHGALDGVPQERAGAAARHARRREGRRGRLRLARRRGAARQGRRGAARARRGPPRRRPRRDAARAGRRAVRGGRTWRASWASTPSRRCATPTDRFAGRFAPHRGSAGRRRGAPSPTRPPTSRTGCGRRRRTRGKVPAIGVKVSADAEADREAVRLDGAAPESEPSRPVEAARREAMYRGELEERAALLHRLGHGKRPGARAPGSPTWAGTFAGATRPLDDEDVDAIVDRVFGSPATASRPARQRRSPMKMKQARDRPALLLATRRARRRRLRRRRGCLQRRGQGPRRAEAEAGRDADRARRREGAAQEGRRRARRARIGA